LLNGGMSTISFHYKWAFIGSGYFAREVLRELYFAQLTPDLVITTPDKPAGRGMRPSPNPVKDFIMDTGIKFYEAARINSSEVAKYLKENKFDFLVVCDFGKILKESILSAAKYPALNIHPSLLPCYRGAAPIERSLMDGVKETGVTIIEITMEIDAGPIVDFVKISVERDDTKGTLMEKLAKNVPLILRRTFEAYLKGTVRKRPQQGEATYAPKIKKEELLIEWSQKSDIICNKIRALSPIPGARTYFHNSLVKILNARVFENTNTLKPGEIKVFDNRLIVGTGDGVLEICELQPSGKRIMKAKEFIAGRNVNGRFFSSKEVVE